MVANRIVYSAVSVMLCLTGFIITTGNCTAYEYDQDVSEGIPAFWYVSLLLNLDKDQYVHLNLHVTGSANFYFVDATGLSNFQSTMTFSYYAPLSETHTNEIDKTSRVPYGGTWYVIVDNSDGLNSLSLTGHISAYTNPLSDPVIGSTEISVLDLALIGVAVVGAVVIVAVIVSLATRKPTSGTHYAPPVLQSSCTTSGQPEYCAYCGHPLRGAVMCRQCGRRVRNS